MFNMQEAEGDDENMYYFKGKISPAKRLMKYKIASGCINHNPHNDSFCRRLAQGKTIGLIAQDSTPKLNPLGYRLSPRAK